MEMRMNVIKLSIVVSLISILVGCGGGGGGGATSGSSSAATFTIGSSVTGLTSSGLVLQNNQGDNLTVSANGTATFSTSLANGATYSVTIHTQPSGQNCTISNGSGTVVNSHVTNVAVSCITSIANYTVGGTVSGLTGTLVLQNNGGNNLTITANSNLTFATPSVSGSVYSVTVLTQPSVQTCVVTNGSGNVGNSNVTSVVVTCSSVVLSSYRIGITVSGLIGSGLVLQNNLGNNLSVTTNSNAGFSTSLPTGSTYSISVLTQPSGQTCVVALGSGTVGTANVTSPTVSCSATTYTVEVTVSGLAGTGLILQNNLGNNLSVNANGGVTFSTRLVTGSTYSISVLTQPSGQGCSVSNGNGTIGTSSVSNIIVTCANGVLYSIVATRIGQDFYSISDFSTILQTTFCYEYAYGENASLLMSSSIGFSDGTITFASGASCTVAGAYNPNTLVAGNYSATLTFQDYGFYSDTVQQAIIRASNTCFTIRYSDSTILALTIGGTNYSTGSAIGTINFSDLSTCPLTGIYVLAKLN
jgi:hypothetical protein